MPPFDLSKYLELFVKDLRTQVLSCGSTVLVSTIKPFKKNKLKSFCCLLLTIANIASLKLEGTCSLKPFTPILHAQNCS